MSPHLIVAEFVFTEHGEAAFLPLLDRTLAEVRMTEGCLHAVVWTRPGRRYQFASFWSDSKQVTRWVECEFHREVLVPGFREWCTEGCFGEYALEADHERARRCERCGRWSRALPGWMETQPADCAKCGAALDAPAAGGR